MTARAASLLLAAALGALAGLAQGAGVTSGAIDNCATLLGSLATELRIARNLPGGARSTFACPREREARPAIGASRERVLRALGPPDRTGVDDTGAMLWTYAMASRLGPPTLPGRGIAELRFHFDEAQQVRLLDCEYVQ